MPWVIDELPDANPSLRTPWNAGCAQSSIRTNAARHLHNRFLLKADFANFFPSIKEADLRAHIGRYSPTEYSKVEIDFLCRMLLWRAQAGRPLEVCIGAPSSPALSNSVMYDFDLSVSAHCIARGVTYSRYADDLALSSNSPGTLESITKFLDDELLKLAYPKLTLNAGKTIFTSKKFRRSVTGLVLANQGYISLGRERKRQISAMVHRFGLGVLNGRDRTRLTGLLAFVQDVEPEFLERLEAKYSAAVILRARGIGETDSAKS